MIISHPLRTSELPFAGSISSSERIWDEMHDLGLTKEGSPRQQSCFTGLMNAAAATGPALKTSLGGR